MFADAEFLNVDEDEEGEFVEIDWTEPQTEFLHSVCPYPLFIGGFGSGKSVTMAGAMMRDLLDYPGANIAGYAPSYDLLTLITIPNIIGFLESMKLAYTHNQTRYTISVLGYGSFIFRSLNNPERIVGYQVFRSHIDELDTLAKEKAEKVWNKVIARNRQKVYAFDEDENFIRHEDNVYDIISGDLLAKKGDKQTVANRVSTYTTPEGYLFCYDRWVKNKVDGYELYRAPTRSNPHLPIDYIANLRATYPEQLIEAYLNGEFVNLTSGAVYPNFDRVLNGSSEIVRGNEPLEIGMDFNVLWGAAGIHVMRDGKPHCVDEIHQAYDTDAQIKYLHEIYPDNPITIYPDATGKSRKSSNTTQSDIAKLKLAGFRVNSPNGNPLIKDRVNSVNAKICNGKGERSYFVNEEMCPNIVAGFEQQVYDANGLPDKSNNLDHPLDGCGYYIHRMWPIKKRVSKAVTQNIL